MIETNKRTISVGIMARYMSEKELREFLEKYDSFKQRFGYSGRIATENDKDILKEYKKGTKITDIAKARNTSVARIQTSILVAIKAE